MPELIRPLSLVLALLLFIGAKVVAKKFRMAKSRKRQAPERMKVGTDCSGIDIGTLALEKLGIDVDHEFAAEISPFCRKMVARKKGPKPKKWCWDIRVRDAKEAPYTDLFIATPECKDFSSDGLKRGANAKNKRGVLIKFSLHYIQRALPKAVMIEQVPGLLHQSHKDAWEIF